MSLRVASSRCQEGGVRRQARAHPVVEFALPRHALRGTAGSAMTECRQLDPQCTSQGSGRPRSRGRWVSPRRCGACLLVGEAAGAMHLALLERTFVRRAVGEGVRAMPRILVVDELALPGGGAAGPGVGKACTCRAHAGDPRPKPASRGARRPGPGAPHTWRWSHIGRCRSRSWRPRSTLPRSSAVCCPPLRPRQTSPSHASSSRRP